MAYAHIYLSPHLDDAALSCGGTIARQAAAGEPVLVLNICSGAPAPGSAFSPFAQEQHRRWDLPPNAVVLRRHAEDAAALHILGAAGHGLGLLDAIYRMPGAYVDDATLFGAVAADDALADQLRAALPDLLAANPGAQIYAPLGVGNHVDHQAAFGVAAALAAAGAPVACYEDFPYVARAGALQARLATLRLAGPPRPIDIAATLGQKIAAIGAYASQLAVLFGGAEAMAAAVRAHGAEERFWPLSEIRVP
jgi:LmbE family N-acetylglucosaminyl deacetylase